MLELSETCIAVGAEQPSDDAGFVAMIYVEPASRLRVVGSTDSAETLLLSEHPVVRAHFDPVAPPGIQISMVPGIRIPPSFARLTVRRRVSSSAGGHTRDTAGLAVVLLSVAVLAIGAELLQRFHGVAFWAVLRSFRRFPSRVLDVAALSVRHLAGSAVARQSVRSFFRNVELRRTLDLQAPRASLFSRRHGLLLQSMKAA